MNTSPCADRPETPCLNLEALRLRESINGWFSAVFSVEAARLDCAKHQAERSVPRQMEDAARRLLAARARFVAALKFHYRHVDPGVLNDREIFAVVLELNRLESDGVFRSVTENITASHKDLKKG